MQLSTNVKGLAGRIGLVLIVGVIAYVVAFKRASQQVDNFCARVSTDTSVAALPDIARELGVKLQGPELAGADGGPRVAASVANPFTMGDYACRIGASALSGKVESKSLGY